MSEETNPVEESTSDVNPEFLTAFVVAIADNGAVYLERSPEVLKITVKREATLIEIRRYVSEILMDLQAQAAAEYTLTAFAQQTRAAEQSAAE